MGANSPKDNVGGDGSALQERLADPHVQDGLARILDRIDTLEAAIERLSVALNQGPGMIAMATDMVDEQIRQAAQRGVYFDDRLQNTLHLLEKLTQDATVQQLEGLLELAQRAPGLMAMTADMADDMARQAAQRGINLDDRLHNALHALECLTSDATIEQLDTLLALAERGPGMAAMVADMFDEMMAKVQAEGVDPQELGQMLKTTTAALSKAKKMPPKKIGLFGLMGALKDPDRQKALGFLMNFLKALGKSI